MTGAAQEAGRIALRFWKRDPESWDKGDGAGPVTEADLAVNRMLQADLCAARPGYGWLSEETEDSAARGGADRLFIVDPIDGTRAFIAGEEHFAHSLAVAVRGRVVAGVVYLPAIDRLYAAVEGGGATVNGVPLRASDRATMEGASILSTKANFLPEQWPGGVPDLKRSFRSSLAYRLCLVAEGRYDGMLTLRESWEWDIAAGSLMADRAGAAVSDRAGAALRFNTPLARNAGVVAAAPAVHRALIARLNAA